jgi:ketosteroid isomerase-like protein
MPQENAETLRRAIDAFNRRDLQAAASYLDRDSEWDWSRSIGPDRSVYRGPQQIISFWEEFVSGFDDIRMEIEDILERGDQLVAAMLSVMRGRDGIEVTARNAWLITIRDRKLRRDVSDARRGPRSRRAK